MMATHWDIAAILSTLFMLFAVGYWITRPQLVPTGGRLSRSQFSQVVLVVIFGLVTFFVPLARTNLPVMGRTEWSGLAIVSRPDAWKVPPSPVVLDIAASYVLMLCAVAATF